MHFPVSCTAEAQAKFDLGVSQLHSFFYPETVKTFTRVAELDPACAMAYWGLAFAQLPNPLVPPFDPAALKRASDALAKGQALPATQREKDWLAATVPFFRDAATLDQSERTRRYAAAMESLASRYPDDAEAQIFFALALLQAADPHDRTFADQFRAARILERLQASRPRHPGIIHYEIHAYDYSPIASQGLAAADAYAAIAPAAPHAIHMPSHVYSMLGMWDRSIASNQATLVVAQDYAARNFPPGVTNAAAPHSLDFMEYAYLQQGRDREALAVVKDAAAIQKLNVTFLAQATGLAAIPVRYALERGAWAEAAALESDPPPSRMPRRWAGSGRAIGAARLGNPGAPGGGPAGDRADERASRVLPAAARPGYWAEQTEILVQAASGWLARAQGNDAEALRLLRSAADLEDASEKHVAMENRVFPVREQLAYLLLELGQAEAALVEFQASMKSTPNRLRGYYGAARAAELAGLPGIAAPYRERLRELTKEASGSRAEIAYARGASGRAPVTPRAATAPASTVLEAGHGGLHEAGADLLGGEQLLRRRKRGDGPRGLAEEAVPQPLAAVEEQLGEPVPLERLAHRLLHRVARNGALVAAPHHVQGALVAGGGAHAAADAGLLVEPGGERVLPVGLPPRRHHLHRGHRTGPGAAGAAAAALASERGAKPLPFTALSPQRFAAWSCSQQQPQQLQTKVGRSWTLSAIWTSPFSREAVRMSSASDRSTARPKPRRVTNSAPPFRVRHTSMGASQAWPRCSCLWRQ